MSLSEAHHTQMLRIEHAECYVFAREQGLFEPLIDVGENVAAGQLAGLIHHPDSPWKPASEIIFSRSGVVVCVRFPAQVELGDCVFEVAEPI